MPPLPVSAQQAEAPLGNTFLHQLRPGAGRDGDQELVPMEEVARDEDGLDGTAKDRALCMD